MADPSEAGPYDVSPSGTLAPGTPQEIRFAEVATGPANKEGFLRKLFGAKGGMDFIYIVNDSAELISVRTRGGRTFIPPATSQSLDSGVYRAITVENEGGSNINTGADDQVKVLTGNNERDEGTRFSAAQAVSDVIPGLQINGQR